MKIMTLSWQCILKDTGTTISVSGNVSFKIQLVTLNFQVQNFF